MIAVATIMVSCSDDQTANTTDDLQEAVDMSDFYLHTDNSEKAAGGCFTMQKLNDQLDKDPQLAEKMYNIEKKFRQNTLAKKKPTNPGGGGGGTPPPTDNLGVVTIPVYVHVVYSNSNQNISSTQINSQISVLNDDFSGRSRQIQKRQCNVGGVFPWNAVY